MPRPNEIAADARALYGPLDQRPSAQEAGDGALWVDPGAGHALYQVQSGNWITISPGEAGGTVTSVGLATSGLLHSVSGSPVTGSGTLSLDLKTQVRNTVLAGPGSGADATPTMRALVAADIPSLDASSIGSGTLALARLGGITSSQLSSSAGILGTQLSASAGILGSQLDAAAGIATGQITSLAASKLTGTIGSSQLAVSAPTSGQLGGLTTSNLSSSAGLVAGQITSVNPSALTGSGTVPLAALAGLTTTQLAASAGITSGQIASCSASTLTGSATLADAVLSTNVPLLNAGNVWTNAKTTWSAAHAASANSGVLNVGAGPFDGSTSGKFAGASTGTLIAVNAPSGTTSSVNLLDLQVAGTRKLAVDATGQLTVSSYVILSNGVLGRSGSVTLDNTLGGGSGTSGNAIVANAKLHGSSGTDAGLAVTPVLAQSGTAGYTALLVNSTETTPGSGTKLLLDLQVGGSSKASIDNTGGLAFSPTTSTTAPSAGAGNALPATPAGYATVTINGVQRSIAYY